MVNKMKAKGKVRNGEIDTTVSLNLSIKLNENDIFNWLNDCSDSEVLRRLGRAALSFARAIENLDNSDIGW